LQAGANDFSGTLMEENISKAAGATHGEYVSPEEFRRMIWSIGRTAVERTTTYGVRRTFAATEENVNASGVATATAGRPDVKNVLPMIQTDAIPAEAAGHGPYAEGAY